MLNRYIRLQRIADRMIEEGNNALNPVIRSIYRKLEKIYRVLTPEERNIVDYANELYLQTSF